jgi:hypothetical protein
VAAYFSKKNGRERWGLFAGWGRYLGLGVKLFAAAGSKTLKSPVESGLLDCILSGEQF